MAALGHSPLGQFLRQGEGMVLLMYLQKWMAQQGQPLLNRHVSNFVRLTNLRTALLSINKRSDPMFSSRLLCIDQCQGIVVVHGP